MPTPAAVHVKPDIFVEKSVWNAVAGAGVDIPGEKSYVYYFPQGHLEQLDASSPANNHNFTPMRLMIHCRVFSVRLHFDPVSDQPFAKIALRPTGRLPIGGGGGGGGGGGSADDEDLVSVAKILTASDAAGEFSVPELCADMIFSKLYYWKDTEQVLWMWDTLNKYWQFRLIHHGTQRRHLLTTGWSEYVDAKRLVAGDSVVFMGMKSLRHIMYIGVRRSEKLSGSGEGYGGKEVVKEIEKAVRGMAFEVMYYPKIGVPNFVVLADKVNRSLGMRRWSAGMRVRMAVESDDSTRMTSIQGVVAAVVPPASGRWRASPWRMLQVNWDDPEISRNVKNVSPWEVEYIRPINYSPFHADKTTTNCFASTSSSAGTANADEDIRS